VTGEAVRYEPRPSDVSAPFWEATRQKRFILQWCGTCHTSIFFPRAVCPRCLGIAIEWRSASGRGTVYAATIEYRPQNPAMSALAPYVVALIDLEEGPRMLSNVVGCPPESVTVGLRVAVDWEPMSDGRHLPVFRPDAG
jgi:uncharacterized OB-fold protein